MQCIIKRNEIHSIFFSPTRSANGNIGRTDKMEIVSQIYAIEIHHQQKSDNVHKFTVPVYTL